MTVFQFLRKPSLALGATLCGALGLVVLLSLRPLEETRPSGQSLKYFNKVVEEGEYRLTYGWKDFEGTSLRVSFAIAKKDLTAAEDEFGFTQEELARYLEVQAQKKNEQMIAELKALMRRLIAQSGHGPYILLEEKDPLTFQLKLVVPNSRQEEVKAAFESIKARLAREYASSVKRIDAELARDRKYFIEARGLLESGTSLRVNYRQSVQNNHPRVRHVLEALRRVREKLDLRQFLGLSLSFIQDVANGEIPLVEGKKHILGYWVPPRVLANNFGDCDSKGVAFASLWANLKKYPIILIKVPDHMFIAVAIPSFSSEGLVINGLRFTLCEVTGAEKIPPGLVSPYSLRFLKSGHYQYEMVVP